MNREHVKMWTTALRSGLHKQIRGRLVRRDTTEDGQIEKSFCAMGVAALIHPQTEIVAPDYYTPNTAYAGFRVPTGGVAEKFPPRQVLAWLGVNRAVSQESRIYLDLPTELEWRDRNRTRQGMTIMADIAVLNDSYMLTFPQIADMIDYFGIR